MKKQYVAPELEKIIFDVEDIITHSLATSEGDDIIDWSDWFDDDVSIDEDGNIYIGGQLF